MEEEGVLALKKASRGKKEIVSTYTVIVKWF